MLPADGYNKPFLVTYLNTASFALYLLPPFYRRMHHKTPAPTPSLSPGAHYARLRSSRSRSPLATLHPPLTQAAFVDSRATDRLTTKETARLALLFCGAWFAANWSLNKALEWTSVGSSCALVNEERCAQQGSLILTPTLYPQQNDPRLDERLLHTCHRPRLSR